MKQAKSQPVVFLHIGTMKTGTSYVQSLLVANKDALLTAGYLFPGASWSRQVRAVQDVLRRTRRDPRIRAEARGAWAALVRELMEHDGAASIVSVEFLSFAGTFGARRVVRSLGGADVHVVLTVRDNTAVITSRWPTEVHNGSTISWPAYTRRLRIGARTGRLTRLSPWPTVRRFGLAHDVERMLRVWGRLLPSDHLHVVTVPPAGSDRRLLWLRFASAVGVDADVCPPVPRAANESLGYPSTELLRRVNRHLGRMRPTDYGPTVKQRLALTALLGRRDDEDRPRLDRATLELGLAWNARTRDAINRSGAQLVGTVDDLPVHLTDAERRRLEEPQRSPDVEELLTAAVPAADTMAKLVGRRARRLRGQGEEVALEPFDLVAAAERWREAPDPAEVAAADIARLARTAVELHRRLRASPLGAQRAQR